MHLIVSKVNSVITRALWVVSVHSAVGYFELAVCAGLWKFFFVGGGGGVQR